MRTTPADAWNPSPWARRLILGLAVTALPLSVPAQTTPPATDIFVVTLRGKGPTLSVLGQAQNISNQPGYDNQPSWSPDGRSIYFTSVREDAQADIYRFDVARGTTERVTVTAPESEYSATVMPDRAGVSVIRVERDSTQRLWRFPLGGGEPSVIFPTVKPAGYHAWVDGSTAVLFVLGSPNALVVASTKSPRVDTVAISVGRSLHRVPGTNRASFVSKVHESEWWIVDLDVKQGAMRQVAKLPSRVEDYAWAPDGTILAADGSRLLRWDGASWALVGDLAPLGVTNVTRLAVAPRGDRIAVVGVSSQP